MSTTIILAVIASVLLLCYALYYWFVLLESPKVYMQQNEQNQQLIQQMKLHKRRYSPTPWSANANIQLLLWLLLNRSTDYVSKYDDIQRCEMSDGGLTELAWLGLELAEDVPTIVVLHTITATASGMYKQIADLQQKTGWRIVLCLRRGHTSAAQPFSSLNLLGSVDDLQQQLVAIQQRFPCSPLYGFGSSAGTSLLVRYLGEMRNESMFNASFALCPGYDADTAFERIQPFYSKKMVERVQDFFLKPYQSELGHTMQWQNMSNASDMQEFFRSSYILSGFDGFEQYKQQNNAAVVFDRISSPLMLLNALDDPICSKKTVFEYIGAVRQNADSILLTTRRGSHCCYYSGLLMRPWMNTLAADYFLVQHQRWLNSA